MCKHYLFYLSAILPLWGLVSGVVTDNGTEATSRNVATAMTCDPDLDPPTITLLVPNISVEYLG